MKFILCIATLLLVSCAAPHSESVSVGPVVGGTIVPTKQLIRPAGKSVEFKGRPVDLVLSPDAKTIYVKDRGQLVVIDAESWTIRQQLKYPEKASGATMHGIAISRDGSRVFVTTKGDLCEGKVEADGIVSWARTINLPGPKKSDSYPCGVALSADEKTAYVCLSMNNTLATVDLEKGKIVHEAVVGVAPYDVEIAGDKMFVSNWGGRRPHPNERTAKSGGTDVRVDEHGVGNSGTIAVLDLNWTQMGEITTGLHPAQLVLNKDRSKLLVANANSDTIQVIDLGTLKVEQTIGTRPDPSLPFGSMSNALCLSGDEQTMFVANGGNNAIAVIRNGEVRGFIPAGWYPGAVATDGKNLFIANVKGLGSRDPSDAGKWNSHSYWGTVTKVEIPDDKQLATMTKQVLSDALVPQTLKAWEKGSTGKKPVPVPNKFGEPSVIEHVVYIIKENRTYDQIFGAIGKGNSDPKLCIFGREVTPNHHALAEQFVLLDNFYCNGVLSADGHAWATEGLANDYLEKSFGAWVRSYPYPGDDPLAMAPTGFIWDNVLLHGGSFRNFGEMSKSEPVPDSRWKQIYDDYVNKTGKIRFEHTMANQTLKQYSSPDAPGWSMRIPDQIRADVFIKELREFEEKGNFPNLVIIYLPCDHTGGVNPGSPTPAAMVADNDLAVGRIVEAISQSKFWPKTCIFAIEDDPQAGFDHVDGHRSVCLVASPYAKRGKIVSEFYNQTSVLHTMELMLGCPPMNQLDAMAPAMKEVFNSKPDLRPYTVVPNSTPLDQLNPAKAELSQKLLELAEISERQPLQMPDMANEDELNRVLWHAVKGVDVAYPSEWAGAHGRGPKRLHLKFDGMKDDDDD